ncbi:Lysine-specific demethylase, partial [Actinidia chinensis var. chinensis]
VEGRVCSSREAKLEFLKLKRLQRMKPEPLTNTTYVSNMITRSGGDALRASASCGTRFHGNANTFSRSGGASNEKDAFSKRNVAKFDLNDLEWTAKIPECPVYCPSNKPVTYSSRNGHAFYPKPGLVLQGSGGIGIRNDTAKSDNLVDTGARYSVISAEHLGDEIVEPPWLNYLKEWGPKVTYELGVEIEKVKGALSGNLKTVFERLVSILPDEVLGEEGPTGPKMKKSWDGDEVV